MFMSIETLNFVSLYLSSLPHVLILVTFSFSHLQSTRRKFMGSHLRGKHRLNCVAKYVALRKQTF